LSGREIALVDGGAGRVVGGVSVNQVGARWLGKFKTMVENIAEGLMWLLLFIVVC